jgi:hypothetical protein
MIPTFKAKLLEGKKGFIIGEVLYIDGRYYVID